MTALTKLLLAATVVTLMPPARQPWDANTGIYLNAKTTVRHLVEFHSRPKNVGKKAVVTILSIDGGGVRGAIPACFLRKIEEDTGRPISKLFDYIAGTSTGALLAFGVSVRDPLHPSVPRYKARELLSLYDGQDARRLFTKTNDSAWHKFIRALNFEDHLYTKYEARGIEDVLKSKFGEHTRLDEGFLDGIKTLAVSYDIQNEQPVVFTNYGGDFGEFFHGYSTLPIWYALRASTAAPTFFPPVQEHPDAPDTGLHRTMVDGGVYATDPSLIALRQVQALNPGVEIYMVSIGTGFFPHSKNGQNVSNWGDLQWASPLIGVFFDTQYGVVEQEVARELGPQHYIRFQPSFAADLEVMDDVSKVAEIEDQTNAAIARLAFGRQSVHDVCQQLVAMRPIAALDEHLRLNPQPLVLDPEGRWLNPELLRLFQGVKLKPLELMQVKPLLRQYNDGQPLPVDPIDPAVFK